MEETYQLTSALKHISWGKQVTIVTDARFSGVSTGACIGHIGPKALASGPLSKVRDGDQIEVIIDRQQLRGSVNVIPSEPFATAEEMLAAREPHPDLSPHPGLPDDTRLWAALQQLGGGTWGGGVYDTDAIIAALDAARKGGAEPSDGSRD